MRNMQICILMLIIVLMISCSKKDNSMEQNNKKNKENLTRKILSPFRSGKPFFLSKNLFKIL
jgi:PBP1b-binding outer membrane lipoprotein LpoB